jgi:hypothetical protein
MFRRKPRRPPPVRANSTEVPAAVRTIPFTACHSPEAAVVAPMAAALPRR